MHSDINIIYTVFTGSKIKTDYPYITISAGKVLNINLLMAFRCKKIFHYTPEPNEIAQAQLLSRFHKSVIGPHPFNFLFVGHPAFLVAKILRQYINKFVQMIIFFLIVFCL